MRKTQKTQIEDFLHLLGRAHEEIKKAISSGKKDTALDLLSQCQDGAIQIGETIEKLEGENFATIPLLENYCEMLYQIYENVCSGQGINPNKSCKALQKSLNLIKNSVKNEIKVQIEAVFLPYKASMWDSLESIWQAADEDPDCDAYVIPIPYYDKNPDGSFKEMHYEGDLYPDYVPITDYQAYDFQERCPDMIFIHNPYDECNYVTSVHPFFYSKNLKQFTEKLVYVPYFVLDEIDPENQSAVEGMKHFCAVPGVIYADKVIVQSEDMRQIYVNVLTEYAKGSQANRKYWEDKILGLGSPKIDKVLSTRKEDIEIPEEWRRVIEKADGSWKKVIFYNTSVTAFLEHDEKYLEKMKDVFQVFKEVKEEVALLWRPHPLMKATIESMRTELWGKYWELVKQYREEKWGIYDESADLDRAIKLSDAYYGDWSSIVHLCQEAEMPIMIQNIKWKKLDENEIRCRVELVDAVKNNNEIWFLPFYFDRLFVLNIKSNRINYYDIPIEKDSNRIGNFRSMVHVENKIYLIPFYAQEILQFEIKTKKFTKIPIDKKWLYPRKELFMGIGLYKKYLFIFGVCVPVIIRIDITNNSIIYITDWIEKVKDIIFNDKDAFFRKQSILINKKLYMPFCNANAVLEIDCDTLQTTIHKLDNTREGYSGICFSEGNMWLAPRYQGGVVKWNLKTGNTQKIEITEHIDGNKFYVGIIKQKENKILLHGTEGLKSIIDKQDNIYELEGNFSFSQEDDKVIMYYETLSDVLLVYDKANDSFQNIKIMIDKDYMNLSHKIFQDKRFIFIENIKINLESFMITIVKKERGYRIEYKKNCGKEIYEQMKLNSKRR